VYLDLFSCVLNNVNRDELATILPDVNCNAAVFGISMKDTLQICIAYLSLEKVTFANDFTQDSLRLLDRSY
jgi:hypothetical protein